MDEYSMRPVEGVIEGFAVDTVDGLVFTVKGIVQPPERIVAYLRYVPDPGGERVRAGLRYRRVYGVEEQEALLRSRWPSYLWEDQVSGVRLQAVPWEDVRRVYDPCSRLRDIWVEGPTDPLEEAALSLAELLAGAAAVPLEDLGLSGSLLLGLHRPESDIDLVVYGEEASKRVRRALSILLDDPSAPVQRPRGEQLAAIHEMHREETPLSPSDFALLQARKVNEGRFRGRSYFIRFVKRAHEVSERYGDPRYQRLGSVLIRARVADDRDALFTPCRYAVEGVAVLEGVPAEDLREIVSFRGRFAEQARTREWVSAQGVLERVIPRALPSYHRLTVGGRPGDFLLSRPE
jgi:predicted nucleotidyltransferase